MSDKEGNSISTGGMIGIIIGAIGAAGIVATGGYALGRDTVGAELRDIKNLYETCTVSKGSIAIMESLEKLKDANENLFKFEVHASEVNTLNQEIIDNKKRLEASQTLVAELEKELSKSKSDLDEVRFILEQENSFEDTFSLSEATSEAFFDGGVIIGLESIFYTAVSTNIDNKSIRLPVGNTYYFNHNLASCRITYIGRSDDGTRANFSIACSGGTGD